MTERKAGVGATVNTEHAIDFVFALNGGNLLQVKTHTQGSRQSSVRSINVCRT